MSRKCIRIGPHPKVVILEDTVSIHGSPGGSGAFGCRMSRHSVTRKTFVCISGRCGAQASFPEELETLPHKPAR